MARKEKVTRVIDGDTFETNRRVHPVRLADVDAPEKGRPGGARAAETLRRLIGGKEVSVDTVARDGFGRSVANVRVGRLSVNKAMREKI
jgi:endonuclease YncB( thermonuclease family)